LRAHGEEGGDALFACTHRLSIQAYSMAWHGMAWPPHLDAALHHKHAPIMALHKCSHHGAPPCLGSGCV
jgi:hypothetical protein